jgi:transcriptional regulator with XRE-family HTH domain
MSSTRTSTKAVITAPTPDVINELRLSLGMSDGVLASACGIARSTLRTKIRNVDLFTVAELKRIGPVLGADYKTWLEPVAA